VFVRTGRPVIAALAAAGIGFAIPSDTVTRIAGQLIAAGTVTNSGRASLGITAETVADASGQPAGVGVVAVTPGGPAAKAGIAAGDIMLSVAGQPTASVTGLQSVLATRKPGDRVPVRLIAQRRAAHGDGDPGQPHQLRASPVP